MEKGTFYGVGVGPGDPELITLKAVRAIERCPVIAAPETRGEKTLALDIARGAVDLTGKTILPFCTSGGSSIEESMPDLRQIAQSRGAVVGTGLTANSLTESEIDSWLSSNGI